MEHRPSVSSYVAKVCQRYHNPDLPTLPEKPWFLPISPDQSGGEATSHNGPAAAEILTC